MLRAEDDATNHVTRTISPRSVRARSTRAPRGLQHIRRQRNEDGDWFDLVADRCGLARPPRVSRAEAGHAIPPALLSFMSESRRLVNRRMKEALGIRLQYPTVLDGVPRRTAVA
jgi:hypothetical protein